MSESLYLNILQKIIDSLKTKDQETNAAIFDLIVKESDPKGLLQVIHQRRIPTWKRLSKSRYSLSAPTDHQRTVPYFLSLMITPCTEEAKKVLANYTSPLNERYTHRDVRLVKTLLHHILGEYYEGVLLPDNALLAKFGLRMLHPLEALYVREEYTDQPKHLAQPTVYVPTSSNGVDMDAHILTMEVESIKRGNKLGAQHIQKVINKNNTDYLFAKLDLPPL